MVELQIKRHQIHSSLQPIDRSVDFDVPIVPLIVYILNKHSDFLMDETIVTGKSVDLMQLAVSLSQIAAPFLDQALAIIIVLLGESDFGVGIDD